jgi:peroxidase
VNEVPGLSALHVIFNRQHNRLAQALRSQLLPPGSVDGAHPLVLDEALFQTARRILVAQWQHIIFTEWLPIILGPYPIQHFRE